MSSESTVPAIDPRLAVLGGGNLGQALARGWASAGTTDPARITVTRRRTEALADLAADGFRVERDNTAAVRGADLVILAVQPQQLTNLLHEISPALESERHVVVSVVSGVSIRAIRDRLGDGVPVIRAMPNTAVVIRESMTCLAADEAAQHELPRVRALFDALGRTLILPEELMVSATALCACGVAFFLRSVRAASQGGIEIGFHPEEALVMAAQTARGAASLLLSGETHPEREIDRVTTPRGCTIAGLNEMEHHGFSSAMIKAILLSANKAARLFEEG